LLSDRQPIPVGTRNEAIVFAEEMAFQVSSLFLPLEPRATARYSVSPVEDGLEDWDKKWLEEQRMKLSPRLHV